MNQLDVFQKELTERHKALELLTAELQCKANEARDFVKTNLGIDPKGNISIEAVTDLVLNIMRLRETECEASK